MADLEHQQKKPSLAVEAGDSQLAPPALTLPLSRETSCQQLTECVAKMRAALADVNHVDAAYKEYEKLRGRAKTLCEALIGSRTRTWSRSRNDSTLSPLSKPDGERASSIDDQSLHSTIDDRSTFSSLSSAEQGTSSPTPPDHYLRSIRDWRNCIEFLSTQIRTSLLKTYTTYEPQATPTLKEQLLADKSFRRAAISRMRNTSISSLVSANPDFFLKYDIRLRNYDSVKVDLDELDQLIHAGESGISADRIIEEIVIAPRGDAMLEFANKSDEAQENYPVLRFRVSSHILAETSPIFEAMFNNHSTDGVSKTAGTSSDLAYAPTRYTCKDGSQTKLYRMPQLELNREKSLEVLLHAAHMHNDQVPREIEFDQFVAVAEVCMRYQCTSPLEMSVEHRWLPQWIHKVTENTPDGLLLISYAFGLRRIFTRMSKTAILNLVDEKELQSKSWPQKIKDKIWAVRTAKVDQVWACCSNVLQEYLRPGQQDAARTPGSGPAVPTAKPRCPKGSHLCDAASLGWLMKMFTELQILPHVMRSSALSHLPQPPQRSLNQLIDDLRFMAGPHQQQQQQQGSHGGVCDYAPAFRGAVNDIYNSVAGLTLYDVSGLHGWGLSKNKASLPQAVHMRPGPLTSDPDPDAARRCREEVAGRIMAELECLADLHSAKLVCRAWYAAFRRDETQLIAGLIKYVGEPARWTIGGATMELEAWDEMRALRGDGSWSGEGVGGGVGGYDDDDDGGGDDNESGVENKSHNDGEDEMVDDVDDKMTREEAERILYSDDTPLETYPGSYVFTSGNSERESSTEKFRAEDAALVVLEGKSLVMAGDKHLRDEFARQRGLGVVGGDGG